MSLNERSCTEDEGSKIKWEQVNGLPPSRAKPGQAAFVQSALSAGSAGSTLSAGSARGVSGGGGSASPSTKQRHQAIPMDQARVTLPG